MSLPDLYPHQAEVVDATRTALVRERNAIVCMPPGAGKTRTAKWILAAYLEKEAKETQSGHAVFAVHRRGLVDNASGSFNEQPPLKHGVIMSGSETHGGRDIQVASIDTLLSWFCESGAYTSSQTYDVIVFDECHSHISKLRTFLAAHNPKRDELGLSSPFVIGLSATPQAKGLSDTFTNIVPGPATEWLTAKGYLAPFRYFRATQGQLDKLVRRGDEYTPDSVSSAMEGLAGDLVTDWKRLAEGRPTIGFFPRRTHAQEACERLNAAGIVAEYVDGETKDDRRREVYDHLSGGRINYICNVGIIERGTDIPCIGCVQMCTAVGNVVRWRQMIGRGSRVSPGKTDCLVIDHADGVLRHGFFDDDIEWTLDYSTRPAKTHQAREAIVCPSCEGIYRGGKCRCGYEPTKSERKAQGLEFVGGELREITKRERNGKKVKTNEQILVSSLYRCSRRGTWKQALAISYGEAEKQGTRFKVPKRFSVAGRTYRAVPYGSYDGSRRVRELYPFVAGDYSDCRYEETR